MTSDITRDTKSVRSTEETELLTQIWWGQKNIIRKITLLDKSRLQTNLESSHNSELAIVTSTPLQSNSDEVQDADAFMGNYVPITFVVHSDQRKHLNDAAPEMPQITEKGDKIARKFVENIVVYVTCVILQLCCNS